MDFRGFGPYDSAGRRMYSADREKRSREEYPVKRIMWVSATGVWQPCTGSVSYTHLESENGFFCKGTEKAVS